SSACTNSRRSAAGGQPIKRVAPPPAPDGSAERSSDRTPAGPAPRASTSSDNGGSAAGGYAAVSGSRSSPAATMLGGDAARNIALNGPAKRHAANRHSSTTSAGGPHDTT